MTEPTRPDFFIVGAPKCGTTSLYTYLEAHPGIFMSPVKEPYHFCPDLNIGLRKIEDRSEYLSLFEGATGGQRAGEASAWYLYSKQAARLIREFNPAARIIILLRSPADMIFSLYNHFRYSGLEPLDRFEDALEAEADRKAGMRLPTHRDVRETLYYREVASYARQVQRYLDEFGSGRVHVILFDDLRDRTEAVYRDALAFLDVDGGFVPSFNVVNEGKQVQSATLHRLLSSPVPSPLRGVSRRLPTMREFRRWLKRANTRFGRAGSMASETRRSLERGFRAEVDALEAMLHRDLSGWKAPMDVRA